MPAYYNEIDPFAAGWLRELIKAGHIAPGEVDTRSIEDVVPTDLAGFTQCHFFAGIAVWSYALRLAGWPDDRPVWTGSCPCQPFSAAGKGKGFADERHLWPAFFHLIRQRRPLVVFGEQVASKDGLAWFDLVSSDLESAGYSCGAVDSCSAGFGAPHIRQRLYWVADATCEQHYGRGRGRQGWRAEFADGGEYVRLADALPTGWSEGWPESGDRPASGRGESLRLADAECAGLEGCSGHGFGASGRREQAGSTPSSGESCRLESSGRNGCETRRRHDFDGGGMADAPSQQKYEKQQRPSCVERGRGANEPCGCGLAGAIPATGPVNGFWRSADWLYCRDGKWRPVESRTFPLAHGAPARVGRLRGYGNAINAIQAKEFISCFMEYRKSAGRWQGFSPLPLLVPGGAS